MPRPNRTGHGGRRPRAGRPVGAKNRIPRETSLLAQDFGPEALEILISIARDKRQPPASRISACALVLDRGFGRVPSAIDLAVKYTAVNPADLSDQQLAQILAEEGAWDPPGWKNGKPADDRERELARAKVKNGSATRPY